MNMNREHMSSMICAFLIFSSIAFVSSCNEHKSTTTGHERKVCFSQEDRTSAKESLDMLSVTTNKEPDLTWRNDGEKGRYSFLDTWWKEEHNPPLSLAIHRIADFDACIEGYPRRLDFYSEKADHLGYADPVDGVTMLVEAGWKPPTPVSTK
jgi:hypothetical protein